MYRSQQAGAGERLRAAVDAWGSLTDAQTQWAATLYRGMSWWDTAEWAKVYETVKETHYAGNPELALAAAVWMQKADAIRDALVVLDTTIPSSGRLGTALRDLGNGAIEILEGDSTAGIERYTAGLDLFTKVSVPLDLAGWRAALAAMVGPDNPTARGAAMAARDWVRDVGAAGLERIWAAGLPDESVLQQEQAG
jgi:hypothetical protein